MNLQSIVNSLTKYMYPLFESIHIQAGLAKHLSWHQERLNRSYFALYQKKAPFQLEELIQVPVKCWFGKVKARFLYGEKEFQLEFHTYQAKKISSLRLVQVGDFDYSLKYTDRTALNLLTRACKDEEEIILVNKGHISDSSYSNLIFRSGETWYTPDTPLLQGTCRARLLAEGMLTATRIHEKDLASFSAVKLINAMLEPKDTEEILDFQ